MSSIPPPIRRPGSGPGPTSIRPRAAPRPSLLHAIRTPAPQSSSSSSAMLPPPFSSSSSLKPTRTCPNKSCPRPDIADGICRTCGRVVDDSNIVSEVTFGETSSGAAMVQGSFLSADQGGIRSLGANFRRVGGGGGEDREKSVREAKMYIQGFAEQLNLAESLVNTAVQAFKLASNANFIQGRSLPGVAAVCLYVACRNERPCKIMLLDLADLVQINVFKLGRTFKAFNKAIPICNDGLEPVYPEDLIYRFASKLEFAGQTAKVAEDAVRLVKRMSRDWMVMGRRPSGICGACLLMAARMNNFRRTVREVVYIVKVTNHTIQNRLEEFKVTESSAMTVEDFLSQDLLESSHDPPSFYRKSAEYQARMRCKRKRGCDDDDDDDDDDDNDDNDDDNDDNDDNEGEEEEETEGEVPVDPILGGASSTGVAPDAASATATTTTTTETDKHINKAPRISDKDANLALEDPESEAALSTLARSFGATVEAEADNDDNCTSSDPKGKRKQMPVDLEWEADENELEAQISEIFNDPHTQEHATAFTTAQKVATERSKEALAREPTKKVSMAAEVGEDEFANDPEVLNCLLSEEEARIKEVVWSNENKDWLRAQQEKVFRMKLAAERPRQTRRRKKRPRMGEGQSEPAGSAVEAAVSVMKERGISKRINYEAIRSLFEVEGEGGDEGENEEAGEERGQAEEEEEEEEEEYEQMGSPEGFDEEELDEGEEEEEPEDYEFED